MGKKKKTDKRPQKCGPNYTVHFSLVVHSCQTFCDPMDCSMPGLPVHHQLQDPTQTHWIGDAIQPSHPLSSPSSPAPNPSQHQYIFKWVSSSHQVAKALELQLQHQSSEWTLRTDLLAVQRTLNSLFQHHSSKPSILQLSFLYSPTLTSIHDYWKNHSFD